MFISRKDGALIIPQGDKPSDSQVIVRGITGQLVGYTLPNNCKACEVSAECPKCDTKKAKCGVYGDSYPKEIEIYTPSGEHGRAFHVCEGYYRSAALAKQS